MLMASISLFACQGEELNSDWPLDLPTTQATAVFLTQSAEESEIDFDSETGEGFVGRGDIISNLGKDSLSSVSFRFESAAEYEISCIKTTSGTTIHQTFKRSVVISGNISHQIRTNKKGHITGYILQGYSDFSEEGNASCPGGFEKVGESILVSSEIGGLYADDVLIWQAQ